MQPFTFNGIFGCIAAHQSGADQHSSSMHTHISSLTWLSLLALSINALPMNFSTVAQSDAIIPPRSIVYVQSHTTPAGSPLSMLPLTQNPTNITHVYLAAVHVNENPGDVHLNDNTFDDPVFDTVWQEAATLQQNNIKIVMMIGGAATGSFQRLCSGNVINESYYTPLRDLLRKYNADGVDLDIEEQVDISCPLALLRRFDQDFGASFILTMAPVPPELQYVGQGLSRVTYSALDAQAISSTRRNGKLVDWYNVQFYNGWGNALTTAGYDALVSCGYSPNRLVMGVLDSPRDGGAGWYAVDKYRANIAALKQKYPDFGGTFGWEYWDAGSGDNLPEPWQWAQAMGNVVPGSGAAYDTVTPTSNVSAPADEPWSVAMKTLMKLGVPQFEAVRAMNMTKGNLEDALGILKLV